MSQNYYWYWTNQQYSFKDRAATYAPPHKRIEFARNLQSFAVTSYVQLLCYFTAAFAQENTFKIITLGSYGVAEPSPINYEHS